MAYESGKLTILAERGGTIGEVTRFLSDLESAYDALYLFERSWLPGRAWRHLPPGLWWELGYPMALVQRRGRPRVDGDSVPPRARLTLQRVRIESPGFWEFAASLNPLQQIREYLNDRHRRRQDKEFREAAEKERLTLENELLRRQLAEKDNSIVRERIALLREVGYSDEDIDRIVWASIGAPLTRLGRHQDTQLIGRAE